MWCENMGNEKYLVREKYALDFDGSDDYVDCDYDSSLDISDNITISFWLKRDSVTGDTVSEDILGKTNSYGFHHYADDDVYFDIWLDGTRENPKVDGVIEENKWYHIVGTYDGSDIKIYVNNSLETTQSVSGSIDTNTNKFLFAKAPRYNDDSNLLNGSLDNVRIYDRTLSEAEIEALYKGNEVPDGLVGHWKMKEGEGDLVRDYSGNGNDGTNYGATWTNIGQEYLTKSNYSLYFDGDDDYVEVPDDSSLNQQKISFGCWVNFTNFPETDEAFPISKEDYNLVIDETGNWGYLIYDSDDNQHYEESIGSSLSTDMWIHLMIVYDGSEVVGYVNGTEDFRDSLDVVISDKGSKLYFGSRGDNTTDQENVDGKIDDTRIYSRALTPEEVEYLYNNRGE